MDYLELKDNLLFSQYKSVSVEKALMTITDMVSQAEDWLSVGEITVDLATTLVRRFNSLAVKLGWKKATVKGMKAQQCVQMVMDRLIDVFPHIRGDAQTYVNAVRQILPLRFRGELPATTAKRIGTDPNQSVYYSSVRIVSSAGAGTDLNFNYIRSESFDVRKLRERIPVIHLATKISMSNGSTVHIDPVDGALHTAGGYYGEANSLSFPDISNLNGGYLLGIIDALPLSSTFIKEATSVRCGRILMYHDGTSPLPAAPAVKLVIPKGVPSGHLIINARRSPVSYFQVTNAGAGADTGPLTGFSGSGVTELFVNGNIRAKWDSVEDPADSMIVDYAVKKGNSEKIVTLSFDHTTSVESLFFVEYEVCYEVDDVRIGDLFSNNVDISEQDPIMQGAKLIREYDNYCNTRGDSPTSFMRIMSATTNESFFEDAIFPVNWGNLDLGNTSQDNFLQVYIEIWIIYRSLILSDPGFLADL